MEFSEAVKVSHGLYSFNPTGSHLARIVKNKVIIQESKRLKLVRTYTCKHPVQCMEWSCDSEYILCAMYEQGLVQVWSVADPEWVCKIGEGSGGLAACRWSPDGRHVLSTSLFHIKITVWSLIDKRISYIQFPKKCQQNMDFTSDGEYMVLAERRELVDSISLFSCSVWQLVQHFNTSLTDLSGVKFSTDDTFICAWDSSLYYTICFYSLDGHLLSSYSPADKISLGIRSVTYSPTAQFLAVGSCDGKARILNRITWNCLSELHHEDEVESEDVIVYKEVVNEGYGGQPTSSAYEVVSSRPVTLHSTEEPPQPTIPAGVSTVKFSCNSRYLATYDDSHPTAVWIWDMAYVARLKTVLLHRHQVKGLEWDPMHVRLCVYCGTQTLYMWSPDYTMCATLPPSCNTSITSAQWSKSGSNIIVSDSNSMMVAYLNQS